ncbi:MAG: hypothetical protein NC123_01560 [Butyrivibrio sp.]|nr:hypothetical protein [Butyrivibrio sp.]
MTLRRQSGGHGGADADTKEEYAQLMTASVRRTQGYGCRCGGRVRAVHDGVRPADTGVWMPIRRKSARSS